MSDVDSSDVLIPAAPEGDVATIVTRADTPPGVTESVTVPATIAPVSSTDGAVVQLQEISRVRPSEVRRQARKAAERAL